MITKLVKIEFKRDTDDYCRLQKAIIGMVRGTEDLIGWYISGRHFSNKLDALEYSLKTNQPITFRFFTKEFFNLDWSVEPPHSFRFYLKTRAQDLRDRYSYIRIYYSGGVDSQTVLNSFLENSIPIDEIICYRYCPTGNVNTIANSEVNDVAIPFLKENKDKLKNTEITILDIDYDRYKLWISGDWVGRKPFLDRLSPDPPEMVNIFPELLEKLEKKNAVQIQGGQKPKVIREGGTFYAHYYDSNLSAEMGGVRQENFFTSPSFPILHLKQCHLLKNLMKVNFKNKSEINRVSLQLINQACRDPLYRPIDFGKSMGLFSAKTLALLPEIQNDGRKLVDDYLAFFKQDFPGSWFNQGNIFKGLSGIEDKTRFNLGN